MTEAYAASRGPALLRMELADEAIRLGRILHRLLPLEREVTGLLALMLLVDARRAARTDASGELVLLADQDRASWNRTQIREGTALVEQALRGGGPGPYAVQAAIAALHDQATSFDHTDWRQIVALYDLLRHLAPSPLVALNRAVAVGMADGPAMSLRLLDELATEGSLDRYHLLHAARADFLTRLGQLDDAVDAYRRALSLVGNDVERHFLQRQLAAIEQSSSR